MRAMRGKHDFLHRMKIAIIEKAFAAVEDVLFYIDSDAFFLRDPTSIVNAVAPDRAFMHCKEYAFKSLQSMALPAGKPFHDFLNLLRSHHFILNDGSEVRFSDTLDSWNAGVIVLPKDARVLLDDVYALTDQFFFPTSNHASEQYAFSMVLQTRMNLSDCEKFVCHYWHRVKKTIMDEFLSRHVTAEWAAAGAAAMAADIRKFTAELPRFMERHPLTYKDNSIQAFHTNSFGVGYKYATLAMLKGYVNFVFIKDILYHTKRMILGRR
jgi:hypothetical protein